MHQNKINPTALDFFAGSGLVSEGLKQHFTTIWANDICIKKAAVYRANHPDHNFVHEDILNISGAVVPPAILAWGSFPCQDLSLAGNIQGIHSKRSGLFWNWLRILTEMEIKPPLIVAENVVGLVSAAKGLHYQKLHNALISKGYNVGAVIIDASHWVPQSRKRVFVIAVDKHIPLDNFTTEKLLWCHPKPLPEIATTNNKWVWWYLPEPPNRNLSLQDIIDFDAPVDVTEKRNRLLSLIPERHKSKMLESVNRGKVVFPGYKRVRDGKQVLELRFDDIAGCLRTPEGGSSKQYLVLYKGGSFETRLLTIDEVAALMGATNNYQLPGSYNDAYRAMGDAVAVPVTRHLARYILRPLANHIVEHKNGTQKTATKVC